MKSKWIFNTTLFTLALSAALTAQAQTTQPTAASSTNLGNGGYSSSQFSSASPDRVVRWCGNRLAIITAIFRDAGMAKLSGADRAEVIKIYEDGYNQLAQDMKDVDTAYSLTHRAIIRGVTLAQAMATTLNQTEGDAVTRVHVLETYLRFVQKVATDLDIPYYIPYYNRGGCNQCAPDMSEEAFSLKLLEMAESQLKLVTEALTTQGPNGQIFPQGTPTAFLTALEFAAYNSAIDLDASLLSTRLSCVVAQLNDLSARLARFNAGNQSEFRGRQDWAVRMSYEDAAAAINEIDSAMRNFHDYSCRGGYRDPYVTPRDNQGYPLPNYTTSRP